MFDEPKNPKKTLTKEQLDALVVRIDAMRNVFDDIRETIAEARMEPFQDDSELENVIYIAPHIKHHFEIVGNTKLPFPKLVDLFEAWTLELQAAVEINKNFLHRAAVRKHMMEALEVCEIIDFATKHYFDR